MSTSLWRTTTISALGGVFEFYDFVIFAVFAPQIGAAFFPESAGETGATLKAFAVFAVGYFARPVGGILWAHVADRRGRAYVFSHTVLGMAVTTLMIGLLPGHATLGIAAPILLVVFRLMQGMALGGEIPASLCWLSEHAGLRRTGLVTAILLAGVNSGMLMGQGVSLLIDTVFGSQQVLEWAWRLAFVFGSCIGVFAYVIRRHVGETPAFTELKERGEVERLPLRTLVRDSPRALIAGFLMCSVHAWIVAALYLALPTFLVQFCTMTKPHADGIALTSAGCGSVIYIASGWLADRFGARKLCVLALLSVAAAAFPAYGMASANGSVPLIALGALAGAFIGGYLGLLPRLFAPEVRVSGLAVAYDGAAAVVGGTGPFVMLFAAERWGAPGVAALLVFFSACGVAGVLLAPRDKSRDDTQEVATRPSILPS